MLTMLGILMLAVTLVSLALRRERWIVPGLFAAIIISAGVSAAIEYRDDVSALLERKSVEPAPQAVAAQPSDAPVSEPAAEPDEPRQSPSARPDPAPREPAPGSHTLVPLTDDRRVDDDSRDGRRTVVVPAGSAPIRQPVTRPEPARPEPTRPGRPSTLVPANSPATSSPATASPVTPAPANATTAPPVAVVEIPRNAPAAPAAPVAVRPTPAPGPGGSANLTVKIRGPLVETSVTPASNPHLLIILDGGKRVESRPPTRVTENHKDDDPNQPVIAYTYFWENITISFSNIDAGWHVIMIDTGLENSRTHQSAMTGSGQESNDYNGSVELKNGETTVMEFGAKNWLNGQLSRIR